MKILFDHPSPFLLAHGGFQIQIEQTKAALEKIGVEVEYLRWWDEAQKGDIIHYFGRPGGGYIDFAHKKGMKVVVAELHTGLGSRPAWARTIQKGIMTFSKKLMPSAFTAKMAWESYQKADAFVALTTWEKHLMVSMFDADPAKVHVIPNGVEDVFFEKSEIRNQKSNFLVCTATITERKRVLELAEAAVLAKTPLWIIGKPYSEADPYYLRFLHLQKTNPDLLRYEGGISDRARLATIYQEARGFVLLSSMESLSLSALEASASGCPLLLSDLPWARSSFASCAKYCPINATLEKTAQHLHAFYNRSIPGTQIYKPKGWLEIAELLRLLYKTCL
jgi:glycosyltransferase involved in cell wall biosynthesis